MVKKRGKHNRQEDNMVRKDNLFIFLMHVGQQQNCWEWDLIHCSQSRSLILSTLFLYLNEPLLMLYQTCVSFVCMCVTEGRCKLHVHCVASDFCSCSCSIKTLSSYAWKSLNFMGLKRNLLDFWTRVVWIQHRALIEIHGNTAPFKSGHIKHLKTVNWEFMQE